MAQLNGNQTSNTNPYVTSVDSDDGTNLAWHAQDNNSATNWYTANVAQPHFVKIDFGAGNSQTVKRYSVTAIGGNSFDSPKDFILAGSDNDSAWTDLDTRTGVLLDDSGAGQTVDYDIANTTAYRYYRLRTTASKNDRNWTSVEEWKIYDTQAAAAGGTVGWKTLLGVGQG